jgi:glyoxylate reductase
VGRVLVTRRLPDGGLDPLAGHELVGPNADDAPFTPNELRAHAAEVDGIVCVLTDRIDADLLKAGAAGRLRVAANVAVGYDNIDVAAARERGVVVCNTPGVLDDTTADLAFALILAASRLLHDAEADLRAIRWQGWGITQYLGQDVHHATLGIVGYGRIGRAVARRARGFSMRVLYWGPRRRPESEEQEAGIAYTPLDELLAQSDFVSLHSPLNAETRHQIGARELRLMKPTAILINTARGPIVDEAALVRALARGQIAGAGLDVFEHEPKMDPALWKMPNVVLTPHLGSAVAELRDVMANIVVDNILAMLDGRQPPNCVNPQLYRT